ncbi:MAG: hypothetical protein ACK4RZ_09790 [Paracoccaceae bacterium]
MAAILCDDFKRDADLSAQTSGLIPRQVASDPGGGFSIPNKSVKAICDAAGPPDTYQNLLRENERLRRENRILKEERELLQMATRFFAVQNPGSSRSLMIIAACIPKGMPAASWLSRIKIGTRL